MAETYLLLRIVRNNQESKMLRNSLNFAFVGS